MVPASGGGRVTSRLGPAAAAGRRSPPPAASNMADGGVCVAAAAGAAAAGAPQEPRGCAGPSAESERLGRGGVCARGARGGLAAGGRRRLGRRGPPTPLPWCFAVSGEGGRAGVPEGPGSRRPDPERRRAFSSGRAGGAPGAGAGAGRYEWSGAGPRRPPVTAAGGARAPGARPPSAGGKLTPRGARRRGTPVSGSEREAFGPGWQPRACRPAPRGARDWAQWPSLTPGRLLEPEDPSPWLRAPSTPRLPGREGARRARVAEQVPVSATAGRSRW